MTDANIDWLQRYNEQGYHYPLPAFSAEAARDYRQQLEAAETHCIDDTALGKIATRHANAVLPFADAITRMQSVVEPVKRILGPDLIVWNAGFFIKEPKTSDFVSWHQDLTYWGLDDVHEVTAWVALTRSDAESGCVKFVPGSHKQDIVEHRDTHDEDNLLSRGQELAVDVDENDAVSVTLEPGEMSLHHGKVFHGSHANTSDDRRIGLAIRYITPAMKQKGNEKTHARLVSGEDRFGHFSLRSSPLGTLHESDVAAVREHKQLLQTILFK